MKKKLELLSLLALILTSGTYLLLSMQEAHQINARYIIEDRICRPDDNIPKYVKDWIDLGKNQKNLSKLGRILFLEEKKPLVKTNKIYQILVWKHGSLLEKRLYQRYNNASVKDIDPFEDCSVKNCVLTYNDTDITTSDIVIFHLYRTNSLEDFPKKRYKKGQIWAFLTWESPHHTFSGAIRTFRSKGKVYTIKAFNGIFNWSMSYRIQSDIPIPYGRTVVKKNLADTNANFTKRRDVLVAIMGSNCNKDKERSTRWDYVKELQKHIRVDVYGKCGTLKCPGHQFNDCPLLNNYMFYLAFENSNCNEYITEKVWWNGYQKNSIPIVMGGGRQYYNRLLPPNSYINVEDFASAASLANYILRLNETNKFMEYHNWRKHFEVLNEHGYFQSKSFYYCRVCEAMNYNDKSEKIYSHLEDMWGYKNTCHPGL